MTLIENACNNIIVTLDEQDMRYDVPRALLADLLTVELGAARPDTIDRHIQIMLNLKYIRVASRGWGPNSLKYDIMTEKLRKVKALMEKPQKKLEETE